LKARLLGYHSVMPEERPPARRWVSADAWLRTVQAGAEQASTRPIARERRDARDPAEVEAEARLLARILDSG